MIRIAGSVSKGWLAKRLSVAFDRDYYFDPCKRHAVDQLCNAYVEGELGEFGMFYTESNLGRREWCAPEQVLVGGIQPNMIVGMLLGAEFAPHANADADIDSRLLHGRSVAAFPEPAALVLHPLVQQWDREIAEFQTDRAGAWQPIPPFFWDASGRAAVHGAVTTGLKFFGDDFLMNMVVEPDECHKVIQWLTEVSAVLVSHFARVGGIRVSGIHVGECASCMVDVANFRRFVVPAVSELGDQFGAVRFHSCGCSDHILEACGDIRGLASLDVGGATSVAKIRALFGREFPVGIAPLVEDMTAATTSGIVAWLRRIAAENDDGDLTIGYHLEAEYNLETIRALHDAVVHTA